MISAQKAVLLEHKLKFANEFKSTICKLVHMLKAKRPNDIEIKTLGERILTIHSINEFEIIERAGPIIFKYKDLLSKINEIDDVEKMFWSIEESQLLSKSDEKEQFQHILKCVAQEAKGLKEKEKQEITNVCKKLLAIYLEYIIVEKKMLD